MIGLTYSPKKSSIQQRDSTRSLLEYGASFFTTCNKDNQNSLDKIQNNALRPVSGGLRLAPTSACAIHANMEPLGKRRENAALEYANVEPLGKRKDKESELSQSQQSNG